MKVVSEECCMRLILLFISLIDNHAQTINAKIVFSEIGNLVIVLPNIRITLYADVNILTSGLMAIIYLSKRMWAFAVRSRPF